MKDLIRRLVLWALLGACTTSSKGPDASCHLLAGDLVITEIMANPSGDDSGQEWFEVANASHQELDLAGVTIVAAKADGSAASQVTIGSLTVTAGAYVVFGGATPAQKPDYVTYGYGTALGALRDSDGLIAIRCGDTLVDQATYAEATEGVAIELSGDRAPDALANDDAASWCDAATPFAGGDLGTPGVANETCSSTGPGGTCLDGNSLRAIRHPAAGDLIVSEIMADPAGTDSDEEWFEVYVAADVDLNGLGLGTAVGTVKAVVEDTDCLAVAAGDFVVFARGRDAAMNGGLPFVDEVESLGLTNTGGTLVLSVGGLVVDQVTYGKAPAGASWSLDPSRLDATGNDDPSNWCPGVTSYGAGGKGTPGAANPSCS